jgi:hypothetical protein
MKTSKHTALVMAFAGFLFLGNAYAEDKTTTSTQSQEEHHPKGQAAPKEGSGSHMMGEGMMNNGMMGKMDMNQMMGMMHECMSMHKDGKMCDHQTMESCQKNMKKGECMKMMSQAKKQDKADKTKK